MPNKHCPGHLGIHPPHDPPVEAFDKNRSAKDGLKRMCRSCFLSYEADRKARIRNETRDTPQYRTAKLLEFLLSVCQEETINVIKKKNNKYRLPRLKETDALIDMLLKLKSANIRTEAMELEDMSKETLLVLQETVNREVQVRINRENKSNENRAKEAIKAQKEVENDTIPEITTSVVQETKE